MAGYVKTGDANWPHFHIDTPNISKFIMNSAPHKRVVTLQLDGDELTAALWGLENYNKGRDQYVHVPLESLTNVGPPRTPEFTLGEEIDM